VKTKISFNNKVCKDKYFISEHVTIRMNILYIRFFYVLINNDKKKLLIL